MLCTQILNARLPVLKIAQGLLSAYFVQSLCLIWGSMFLLFFICGSRNPCSKEIKEPKDLHSLPICSAGGVMSYTMWSAGEIFQKGKGFWCKSSQWRIGSFQFLYFCDNICFFNDPRTQLRILNLRMKNRHLALCKINRKLELYFLFLIQTVWGCELWDLSCLRCIF